MNNDRYDPLSMSFSAVLIRYEQLQNQGQHRNRRM